ncbi:MAG: hypothetical protein JWM02_3049 [Frankiales bacterium]|nr:hypothetical protein [Frankiales bacterium]
MRRTYRGRDVEVSFDRDLCIHVGACLAGLPEVFELHRTPWIQPDAANAEIVAEVVRRCPSGALRYRRLDGGADEQPASPTTVTPLRNGPLLLSGALQVTLPDGTVDSAPRATLCRCGLSANKPFCDNSHLRSDFTAAGARLRIPSSPVRRSPDQPIAMRDDPRD